MYYSDINDCIYYVTFNHTLYPVINDRNSIVMFLTMKVYFRRRMEIANMKWNLAYCKVYKHYIARTNLPMTRHIVLHLFRKYLTLLF